MLANLTEICVSVAFALISSLFHYNYFDVNQFSVISLGNTGAWYSFMKVTKKKKQFDWFSTFIQVQVHVITLNDFN